MMTFMTTAQSRTLDEQIAHENALIDSWASTPEYNSIIDLSDLDDEEGYHPDDDMDDDYYDEELYDDGDYSQD